jgi:hypothetical protein
MATAQRDIPMTELFKCIGGRMREQHWAVRKNSFLKFSKFFSKMF